MFQPITPTYTISPIPNEFKSFLNFFIINLAAD